LISKQLNEQADIANTLNNIATNYISLGNLSEALIYCNQSYNISATLNDNVTMGNSLDNIASIYRKKGDKNTAVIYFQKGLKIREVVNDKVGIARSFQNICGIYIGQNNYSKALIFANKSLQFGKELNYPEIIRDVSILLTKIYKSTNQPKLALQNYELHIKMRDSISNQENRKASIKSQLKYEYEKKATADSVRVSEEKKLSTIKLKQEQTQRYFLYGGLSLTALFGIFMFNRFRITQKQKNIIQQQKTLVEKQKHIVDEKQKEILDSIRYAKRIQTALIPTEKTIQRYLQKLNPRK
jgi:tetratricopeptide (TPR) repeat protein